MKSNLKRGLLMVGVLFLSSSEIPAPVVRTAVAMAQPAANPNAKLNAIRQRGEITIGVKDNLYPLGYRAASGELAGFEIELARKLALELFGPTADLEAVLKLVPLSNRDRLPALTQGTVDLVIAQLTATDDRRRLIQFTAPYYSSGIQLIASQSSLLSSAELSGSPIGVLANSDAMSVVQVRWPRAPLKTYDSYRAAIRGVQQGEIAAFAGEVTVLAGIAQQPDYQLLEFRLSSEPLAIALPKGIEQDALRRHLDATLRSLQQSGWLRQEAQRWGLP